MDGPHGPSTEGGRSRAARGCAPRVDALSDIGSVDVDQRPVGTGGNGEAKFGRFFRVALVTSTARDGGPLTGDMPIETLRRRRAFYVSSPVAAARLDRQPSGCLS